MKNFKVEVSKWLEKYHLIRKAESESLLKDELHKEWFSVLSILVMDDVLIEWNKFYFEIIQNWTLKVWTIVWSDIFKSYLKIKDQLKYDLKYIYVDKDNNLEEKEKIIHELEEQYRIYLQSNKKELEKEKIKQEEKIKVVTEEKVDNFQMKKELDEVYNIIDKVLFKLKVFIDSQDNPNLNFEKKEKFKELFNSLVKLKSSTNIPKLKQIWEIALLKLWEIELQILESRKDEESQKLLSETNKLLKEVWSKTTFTPKDKDIWYILNNWLKVFLDSFKNNKPKKEKFFIDTKSSSYLKTKLLLEKYEKKLKNLNKEILNNFIIFLIPNEKNNEIKQNFYLRKKVINQNIMILKSRLTWKTYSYTKIIKWYDNFIQKLLNILFFFKNPLFVLIFIYSFLFLILNFLNYLWIYSLNINFYWLFYFLFVNLIFILLKHVNWIISLSFNIVILSFLFIFWVINF